MIVVRCDMVRFQPQSPALSSCVNHWFDFSIEFTRPMTNFTNMNTKGIKNHLTLIFTAAAIVSLSIIIAKAEDKKAAATTTPQKPRCSVFTGQKAPSFQAKTVDNKTINFPADYKGKVVLLDFWATWCGPCRQELPNVVSAYQQYHTNGFEIVSVSMDMPKKGPDLLKFVKDNNMTWPHIYDGGYMNAAVGQKYGVVAIPCPVLVDGDTGIVLAVGKTALGTHLTKHLKSALAEKNKQ